MNKRDRQIILIEQLMEQVDAKRTELREVLSCMQDELDGQDDVYKKLSGLLNTSVREKANLALVPTKKEA